MLITRRHFKLFLAVAAVGLAIPASASAQASRTWVSGVGDDANPCSRTAPCKTFPGAISKTAAKGEINCQDPGGFGGVTINKSITIKCQYTEGGVLVAGTNAIVVNAAATDTVVLRGLDINMFGSGLNGVRVISAKSVKIYDSEIYGGVRDGVDFEPSNANAKLSVVRTHIHDMGGVGVMVAPPTAGTGATARVHNSQLEGNACGIASTTFGPNPAFNFSFDCGTSNSGSGISAFATVDATNNMISDNATVGVWSRGNKSTVRIGENDINGNATGIFAADPGAQLLSYGDNHIQGNTTNGVPTGPVNHAKKKAKKARRR
jgi:hypothetical protein